MTQVTIRPALSTDIDALPLMQVAAGALFRELDMDLVAAGPPPPVDGFHAAQAAGDLLVAVRGGSVVGFVRMRSLDDAAHIDQVTVAPEAQRRGVGRALMLAAERSAAERGFRRMTLTTYRDVAFNGLFYRRLGWADLDAANLTPGLRAEREEEIAAGLDRWSRVAMEKQVGQVPARA
jgi:ribosomal protein S18 acetylase RimI-like enzyme